MFIKGFEIERKREREREGYFLLLNSMCCAGEKINGMVIIFIYLK
jgi:hypothetical protein